MSHTIRRRVLRVPEPTASCRKGSGELRKLDVVELAGAGHVPMYDDAGRVADLISQYARAHRGDGARALETG